MAVKDGHDLITDGDARLEDGTTEPFDLIVSPVTAIEIGERDIKRFIEVLQDFGCAFEAVPGQDGYPRTPLAGATIKTVGGEGKCCLGVRFVG